MKIRKLTILLVFYASFSNAQKYDQKIPDFGKVSKEELQIKECPFDKTAEAYVLFDVEEINCNLFLNSPLSPVKSERERHIILPISGYVM